MNKLAATLLLALSLTGCAAMSGSGGAQAELPVKYATAKVIENSSDITAESVLERVESARSMVERDELVSIDALAADVRSSIDFESMAPSDAVLVEALLSRIEARLDDYDQNIPPDERNVRLLTLLDWVESVATLYAGTDY